MVTLNTLLIQFNGFAQIQCKHFFGLNATSFGTWILSACKCIFPPPSGSLVVEKGLQLQSVEATLNRIIQSHAWGRLYSDVELLHHLSEQDKLGSVPVTSKPHRDSQSSLPRLYQHLVVFTGKSCRFHSQRPIHICLSLIHI